MVIYFLIQILSIQQYNFLSFSGKVGIALHSEWFEPDSEEAVLLAEVKLQFDVSNNNSFIFNKGFQ